MACRAVGRNVGRKQSIHWRYIAIGYVNPYLQKLFHLHQEYPVDLVSGSVAWVGSCGLAGYFIPPIRDGEDILPGHDQLDPADAVLL